MKLRNRRTGEIAHANYFKSSDGSLILQDVDDPFKVIANYTSLAELNEEWEDYEEPKDNNYWYIDDFGRIQFSSEILDEVGEHPNNWMARKLFGNYFGTREEAEKAVEKLKAAKRLKDMGISFKVKLIDRKWYLEPKAEPQQRTFIEARNVFKDIKIIFGVEE